MRSLCLKPRLRALALLLLTLAPNARAEENPAAPREVAVAAYDALYPARSGVPVTTLPFTTTALLPEGSRIYGALIAEGETGIAFRPDKKNGPGVLLRNLSIPTEGIGALHVDIRLEHDGVEHPLQKVRFFWSRNTDPSDTINNHWPFSEERQIALKPGTQLPHPGWDGQLSGHPAWNEIINGLFIELTLADADWEQREHGTVILCSIRFGGVAQATVKPPAPKP
ncbi:MAG: hypothetical protein HYV27_18180 [Candidatus Hydrogenedentes bacterium]|nr:hypothetical protein [Candidatus Hydrogenedentota bacterium]